MVGSGYLLGMDIGTTNIKAVFTTAGGERVASAFRGDRLICPGPGMAEQDALQWWDSAVEIFRELGMKAGRMDWRESGQLRSARRRLRCCPLTPRASLCAMRSSGWTGVEAAS